MPHYVLHEIESGELIKFSDEPFTAVDLSTGLSVEFFKTDLPDQNIFGWNPKTLMWKRK